MTLEDALFRGFIAPEGVFVLREVIYFRVVDLQDAQEGGGRACLWLARGLRDGIYLVATGGADGGLQFGIPSKGGILLP